MPKKHWPETNYTSIIWLSSTMPTWVEARWWHVLKGINDNTITIKFAKEIDSRQ